MSQRRTLLVVDDEPYIRSLLKSLLEREHYRVLEAADAPQALQVCELHGSDIELVLTDIMMPGMDGIELAGRISATSPHIRIMYMSGKCEIEDVQRDVQEKGFGFIRKPFALNTLAHTIAQFLRAEPHKTRKKGPAHEDLPPAASCFGGGSE